MAQVIHKFGHNHDVGQSWEDVWMRGGEYAWPTSATVLRISSDSTADTSTGAGGTGAQTVTLTGLDSNFDYLEETVSLTNSTVVTNSSFMRMNRAYVDTQGTYGGMTKANAGTITINSASSGAVGEISFADSVGRGQTLIARYTIPSGLYGYINAIFVSSDAAKPAALALNMRIDGNTLAAPYAAKRTVFEFDGLDAATMINPAAPMGPFPPTTDLWWSTIAAGVGTGVSASFEIILTPRLLNVSE